LGAYKTNTRRRDRQPMVRREHDGIARNGGGG
jgi:hypothetical protein